MEYDLHSNMQAVHAVPAAAHTGTQTSAEIDSKGFESLEYICHVGVAMVGGGFNITIEQSPDDGTGSPTGTWTAVPAAETLGALPVITIADVNKVYRVGSVGKERFQRLVATESGTISAGVFGVTAIQGNPETVPVAAQNT